MRRKIFRMASWRSSLGLPCTLRHLQTTTTTTTMQSTMNHPRKQPPRGLPHCLPARYPCIPTTAGSLRAGLCPTPPGTWRCSAKRISPPRCRLASEHLLAPRRIGVSLLVRLQNEKIIKLVKLFLLLSFLIPTQNFIALIIVLPNKEFTP
jgi:hypothetical protein